ncbi:MAG: hypothetical protein QJR12_01250 [Mycobacterium sp.]|uniref:hypothetical protein n=1 Tax=Mycobacterium sp. TaxID=1785 RepID=UPI002610D85F|nr:hypothetical protein [Mycobacterium sp.]MDI3312944.1 hypothetical protein [Mycobacterium sp.]
MLQTGDKISIPVQSDGIQSVGQYATITALEDDEPNRRIRIIAKIDATGETLTIAVKPSHEFDRLTKDDDLREVVIVPATDYWKWIGTHVNDPQTGQRVQIIEVVPGPHPEDNHEILAIVVWDGQKRRALFSELTGSMVFEDN